MAKNVKKKLIIVSIICAVIGIAILLGNLYKQYSFNACLKDETSPSRIEMWYGYLARNIGIDVKLAKQQIREQDIKEGEDLGMECDEKQWHKLLKAIEQFL